MSRRFHPLLFALALLASLLGALWTMVTMVRLTDPDEQRNVAIVLAALYIASGALVTLLSWLFMRRILQQERPLLALRHGMWGGLFVLSLPVLRWQDALSPLLIVAVLLIIFGLESSLLLRGEQPATRPSPAKGSSPPAKRAPAPHE